jgi:integrase
MKKTKLQKIISSDIGIKNIKTPEKGRVMYAVKQEPSLYLQVTSKRTMTWYLMAKVAGKVRRFPLGHYLEGGEEGEAEGVSLKSALEAARTIKAEIKAGVDHRERARLKAEREANTYADIRKRFMERYAADLKPSTQAGYKSALYHDKLTHWDELPVHQISRAEIRRVLDSVATTSPVMANRMLAYLRKFFNWCAEVEILAEDEPIPTDRVKPPLKDEVKKRARKRWLSEDEIKVFLRATDRMGYPFGAHFRFLLMTGQRKTEVTMLKWPHIDQTAKQWTQEDNKADRTHVVPLNAPAMAMLADLPQFEYEDDGQLATSDYLFTTMGDRPLGGFSKAKSRLDDYIHDIVKEDGLKGVFTEGWVLHDLRRTMTTHLRKAQIGLDVCGRLLNHAERGVTAQHYDQFDMLPEKTHAMEVWGRTVERIVTGKSAKVSELREASA